MSAGAVLLNELLSAPLRARSVRALVYLYDRRLADADALHLASMVSFTSSQTLHRQLMDIRVTVSCIFMALQSGVADFPESLLTCLVQAFNGLNSGLVCGSWR